MRMRPLLNIFTRGALLLATLVAFVAPAWSSNGTATLTAGSLQFNAPATVSFATTLTGLDQTTSATQAIVIGDATGSGSGWKLQATSTTFCTAGNAHCLATDAITVRSPGPAVACGSGVTCATATNSVSYPYALPAASSAPTATTLFNAAAGTGMGSQTVTATFTVAIPANTYAGSYSSTWTYSLVSAP